jgi:drug/metabolite transporter (DMT)-like permease
MKKKMVYTLLAFLLASLADGLNAIVGKIALHSLSPLIYNGLRFLCASLIMSPFLLAKRHRPKPSFRALAVCSIFTLDTVFFAYGIHFTTATLTSLLLATAPLLTGVFSYVLTREPLSVTSWMGVVLGGIGILVLTVLPTLGQGSLLNGSMVGSLLIAASVAALAIYSIVSRPLQERYSPLSLTLMICYLTTLVMAILALPELLESPVLWRTIPAMTWISIVAGGLTIAVFSLSYQYVIHSGSPLLASLSQYLTPLLTVAMASFLLGEYLTPELLFGALFILLGIFLVTMPIKGT